MDGQTAAAIADGSINQPIGPETGNEVSESVLLKEAGLEGKFGSINEALSAAARLADLQSQLERSQSQGREFQALARERGYKSVAEMLTDLKAGQTRQTKETPLREALLPKLAELHKKHGGTDENKGLVDMLAEALEEALNPIIGQNRKLTENLVQMRDERALDRFMARPENSKLPAKIGPELMRIFYERGLYNPPEGYDGDWDVERGIEQSYSELLKELKALGLNLDVKPDTTANPATRIQRRAGTGGGMDAADLKKLPEDSPLRDFVERVPEAANLLNRSGRPIHPLELRKLKEGLEQPIFGG